ncbi:molybdenum cofactor cytidylyltransferase [Thermohalobacter berrensis]|uniref:Molybdenum cofactor cytidylyltransferase n=1 Tax=Thermohalobacter berrensis TaxID=99594 RepID=A0A419T612_9FIRM|nr:molybdenum cofactor cytidylyltransferase [Thermohalobacter berrensis]RKD32984.1 molybdenum cofactor cytidylyltransferase [Thermohalobacter berrensis]
MITGIIMASGFSRRMSKDKLLLKIKGVPIIERVIKTAVKSKIDEIILIYRKNEIKKIGQKYGIKTIYNEGAKKGQSQSIKLGVKYSNPNTKGFVFIVGDQPFLSYKTVNRLIDVFLQGKHLIVVPMYREKRGNPVIFSSKLNDKLLNIYGDKGGRDIIKKMENYVEFVNIKDNIEGIDIDKWQEYVKYREMEMNGYV